MNIIIGNVISLIATGFMISSSLVNKRKTLFLLQTINAVLLIISSLFLFAYSGAMALFTTAIRNYAISIDKFSKKIMIFCVILTIILGLISNNRGLIGLLPIIATCEYSICGYYFEDIRQTKMSLCINLFLWVMYSVSILDIPTALTDFTTFSISAVYLLKTRKKHYKENTL